MEKIPMSAPDLDESDIQEVLEVLRSGRLALGPKAIEFEERMADYIKAYNPFDLNTFELSL